jgi:hypothetical protein
MLIRLIKPIALFLIMFLSLRYLGVDTSAALIASMIPLVLGFVGVLTTAAYGVAGVVFIAAALSALLPPENRNIFENISSSVSKLTGLFTTETIPVAKPKDTKSADKSTAKPATQKP